MEPDNSKASRQSLDSAHSTTPFIQKPTFQPPPNYPELRSKKGSHGTAMNIKVTFVVLAFRILAFVSGLSIGIGLAVLGVHWAEMIVLAVFTWASAAWNGFMIIGPLRKQSFRLSLAMSDGRVISFGPRSNEEVDRPKRCCSPIFWVDFFLFTALITLNIVNTIRCPSYYLTNLGFNWFTIIFQLVVTLLTASPALLTAHIRIEPTETPQISLP
ncbi:hypothetical protein EKO27_g4634 [Xylaria grammica]|uniref:Uncharacterized protein n=1 Tax=Xylaria grammica TaxID=363999 RepID=A0A439D7U9_9PEZI|nr:hypothetical protein EKO27_g4634 [Xylaria grammica]